MTTQRFEHPLNEKTRSYLRIESLLNQAQHCANFTDPQHYQVLFRSLFDLLDIFEQLPLKPDLLKDLDKLRVTYANWLNVEGVDQARLNGILNQLNQAHTQLLQSPRLGTRLKEDRFLSSIRQRFNLPGGTCCFDLPALHYWLNQPLEKRQNDARQWLASVAPLSRALQYWLNLTRESARFKPQVATNGLFSTEADEPNLVRMHFPQEYGVYPMLSGHKSRFTVRFIHFDTGQASTQDIEFELAVCS